MKLNIAYHCRQCTCTSQITPETVMITYVSGQPRRSIRCPKCKIRTILKKGETIYKIK